MSTKTTGIPGIGVARLDGAGNITELSGEPAAAYDLDEGDVIGKRFLDLFSCDDHLHELLRALQAGEAGDSPAPVRATISFGGGGTRVWQVAGVPDVAGGVVLSFTDVTEISRELTRLRRSEGRLRQALHLTRIGVWDWEIATDETIWTDELLEIYGVTREEFTGKGEDYFGFTHPDDREKQQANVKSAFERTLLDPEKAGGPDGTWGSVKPNPKGFRLIRKDGEVREVMGDAVAIVDEQGNPVRMLGTLVDVTEQREATRAAGKLLRAIEQSPDTVVITDDEGYIEYVNPAFTRITGFTAKEAEGENPRILKSGKHDEAFYKELWETITAGKVWSGVFHNQRKDGGLYWESATIAPVFGDDGGITNFIAVKEDITKRVETEGRLRDAFSDMRHFSYAMAHDLKTPVMGIAQIVGWLKDDLGGRIDGEVDQYLTLLGERSERLVGLIDGLLGYVKLGLIDNNLEEIDILELLEAAAAPYVAEDRLRLQMDDDCIKPMLNAPRARLESVFLNLLDNAVKHCEKPVAEVNFRCEQQGGFHVFYIEDNGPGIPEKYRERVFKVFQKLESHDSRKGAGIGLAQVKKAVEGVGGRVEIGTGASGGAAFTIFWPLKIKTGGGGELPAEPPV